MKTTLIATVSALCFALSAALPTTSHAQGEGQKWEYAEVVVNYKGFTSAGIHKDNISQVSIKDISGSSELKMKSTSEVFTKIKNEKWEIFDTSFGTLGEGGILFRVYMLRRPAKN
ncbi:MAG: hypothetical protein ACOCZ8_04345 [Bacteroidota bacterium]